MVKQQKLNLGYRYKESKSVYKNGLISACGMGIVSFILAIITMFIEAKGDQRLRYVIVGILIFCSLVFFCMIPLILKTKKQILKNNNYPEVAIYYKDKCIYISTEEEIKINIDDIQNVEIINNNKFNNSIKEFEKKNGGSLNIVTKTEKYFVPQLKNVEKVKENILNFVNSKNYLIENIYFIYDKYDMYEAICEINNMTTTIKFSGKKDIFIYTIDTVKYIINHFDEWYEKVLDETSKDIVGLANEWNEEEKIFFTFEDIKRRINDKYLTISIFGFEYSVYFDDDNIFFGHSIVYSGNIDDDDFYVDIEG